MRENGNNTFQNIDWKQITDRKFYAKFSFEEYILKFPFIKCIHSTFAF